MSAATLHVTVMKKEDAAATVKIVMAHPDEHTFCMEKNCALQILWSRANPSVYGQTPLGAEVTIDNILDPAWLVANADRFIGSVRLLSATNYPLEDGVTAGDFPAAQRPTASVAIQVTDPRWIAHFAEGDDWEAAPFDATAY